jgi:prophage regulatory protein
MAKKMIRLPSVIDRTGWSRSGIYQGMADGTFPKSIKISKRGVAWIEEEIDAWIEEHIEASRRSPSTSKKEA